MNILFISSFTIDPIKGGVERVTFALGREFILKGMNVIFLTLDYGKNDELDGIKHYYLPNGNRLDDDDNNDFFSNLIDSNKIDIVINQVGVSIEVLEFIQRKINFSIKVFSVHHNCLRCLNDQYHKIYLNTLKKKRLDLFLNNKIGWYVLKKFHKRKFGNEIRKTLELSSKLVLLSERFIDDISFFSRGFDKSKVVGILNPCPFNDVNVDIELKENRLLFVGRLNIQQKRVDRLVNMWEEINHSYPDWYFDIVGDGIDKKLIEDEFLNRGLTNYTFHGFNDPTEFYQKSKIFVMPSDFEGFGMVLVEAQAFGVVPISFRSFNAINDVISHNNSGIIVEDYNEDEFVNKIKMLITNKVLLNSMVNNAIELSKSFNVSQISQKWINLFS